ALGSAVGSSVGLVIGSALGNLILPGVGAIAGGLAAGVFLSPLLTKKLARKNRNIDKKLSVILDSIAEKDEVLREDILTILEASIDHFQEDTIKELLIKMRISVNFTNLQRPQKIEIAGYIMATVRELEGNEIPTVRYFLERIASLAENFPSIVDASRELENNLSD
ncbi:MAG: hypothetical protein AB4290_07980, partial [Spirulina sp.]